MDVLQLFQIPAMQAVLALTALALAIGAALGYAAARFRVPEDPVVERINELLPQTQCGQCGHPGCRPYAEGIANGEAINKCPPGGQRTVEALAGLLGREAPPLDGEALPPRVAYIREAECIGCTRCIQACPVDAIVGAARFTHTVIASECTGCDLCVAPCPVDCIDMLPLAEDVRSWRWPAPDADANLIATDRGAAA